MSFSQSGDPQVKSNFPLYVGKFDYYTQADNEVPFNKGDLLYVIKDSGDWWYARVKHSGQEGYIPRNYVAKYILEAEE